jgi:hypothetical protein
MREDLRREGDTTVEKITFIVTDNPRPAEVTKVTSGGTPGAEH